MAKNESIIILPERIPSEINLNLIFSSKKEFNFRQLTEILGIEPTIAYKKGERIRKDIYRKSFDWILTTPTIKSLDLEIVYNPLIILLKQKTEMINRFLRENTHVEVCFIFVVHINYPDTPSFYLSCEFIDLARNLRAGIDFDTYIIVNGDEEER